VTQDVYLTVESVINGLVVNSVLNICSQMLDIIMDVACEYCEEKFVWRQKKRWW
jgi:hypothetical protein